MSSQEITVHKLEHSWTIYEQVQFHNEKDKKKGYLNSFEKICTFSTAEGFWLNWNRIPTVTQLFYDGENRIIKRVDERFPEDKPKDIKIEGQSIFKDGITPEWEDEVNAKGGELRVEFDVSAHDTLGKFWETIVLTLIGETMDKSDSICGARILDKSKPQRKQIGYRLEVWYKNWEDKDIQQRLEKTINKILKDFELDRCSISFKQHDPSKW
ncbi:translation initiation factor 4E [Blastocystis sp. subtype 4]|uniref:translation initiation factor 4E n=1 Tax=Blastocystis sp. subtype 4 TaxID=944170 RepID=UPI0007119DAB|nr:translation initiation factor 4E [Blastocystis sp. subtype 4]KNB46177.1 translation initiation factor 4E [Blastocystis sp. subtype 4]|eukprot:XP_014529620.1 translation initiation factor 4E [Blastocystis sp. subtype 4]